MCVGGNEPEGTMHVRFWPRLCQKRRPMTGLMVQQKTFVFFDLTD